MIETIQQAFDALMQEVYPNFPAENLPIARDLFFAGAWACMNCLMNTSDDEAEQAAQVLPIQAELMAWMETKLTKKKGV